MGRGCFEEPLQTISLPEQPADGRLRVDDVFHRHQSQGRRTYINLGQGLSPLVVWQVGSVPCIRLQFIFVLLILLSLGVRLGKIKMR